VISPSINELKSYFYTNIVDEYKGSTLPNVVFNADSSLDDYMINVTYGKDENEGKYYYINYFYYNFPPGSYKTNGSIKIAKSLAMFINELFQLYSPSLINKEIKLSYEGNADGIKFKKNSNFF